MHLLSSEKNIVFNGDMLQVFGTLLFFQQIFFEATSSHVSADNLQLEFQGMKSFLIHSEN